MTTPNTFADDLRQMMADWDAATPEQRAEALRLSAAAAAGAVALGKYAIKCDGCGTPVGRTDSLSRSAAGGWCDTCRPPVCRVPVPKVVRLNGVTRTVREATSCGPGCPVNSLLLNSGDVFAPIEVKRLGEDGFWSMWNGRTFEPVTLLVVEYR